MRILECDSCHAKCNDYGHWYGTSPSRNMYELRITHDSDDSDTYDGMIFCHKCINKLIEQEPKTGRWLDWTDDRNDYLKCSICGYGEEGEVKFGEYTPYCPMCGSKMESEE